MTVSFMNTIKEFQTVYSKLDALAKSNGYEGGIKDLHKQIQSILCQSDTSSSSGSKTATADASSDQTTSQVTGQQESTTGGSPAAQPQSAPASDPTREDAAQPAGTTAYVQVQVPPGVPPGSVIHVQIPGEGRTVGAVVPPGVSEFRVAYQPAEAAQREEPVVVTGFPV